MPNLKINEAPLLPNLTGIERIPTGGRGNFTTSVDQLKEYIAKDLQVNVDAEASRLDAVDVMLDARISSNTLDISQNTGRIATVESKVSTVAIGATANATNAQLRDRTTHTGVQPISSVSNLQTELNNRSLVGHTHTQQQVTGLVTRLSDIESSVGQVESSVGQVESSVDQVESSVAAESQARILFEGRRDNPHQVTAAQLTTTVGSVTRTQADKNAESISVKDFGAKGDGTTDDTAAFVAANIATDFAFVPDGLYKVNEGLISIEKLWGSGRLLHTDGTQHWVGLTSKGCVYIRNDDRNADLTPKTDENGLLNIADGELMFFVDLDGDGDYDADIYGRNNLYVAARNSIHLRIAPQQENEGRIRLAATTNTNFIQSGKDFSGTTLKNLALGPYLSNDYWVFIRHTNGFVGIGNNAELLAPLHIQKGEATAALFENTDSDIARIGFKSNTTTASNTVCIGANGDDMVMRSGGFDQLVLLSDGRLRPVKDNLQSLGTSPKRFSELYAGNGIINTSDERLKTAFDEISIAEKQAALRIKASIGKFRFTDAVDKKGDAARVHFGVGAQTVRDIMQDEGLDPAAYGFFCHDTWQAAENLEAGDRFGIRYDQLAMFILASI